MAFRDDMEALCARNESLEAELESHRAVERVHDELKELVEEQKKEIIFLKQQLQPLEEVRRKRFRNVTIIFGVGLLAFVVIGHFHLSEVEEECRTQWLAENERAEMEEQRRSAVEGEHSAVRRELENARTENTFLDRELREVQAQAQNPFDVIVLPGRVRRVTGQAPSTIGTSCTIEVRPNFSENNCRVIVSCGGAVVYGTTGQGYNTCSMRDERPTFARETGVTDEDGDPMFELDLLRGHVMISDGPRADAPEYTLEIAIEDR